MGIAPYPWSSAVGMNGSTSTGAGGSSADPMALRLDFPMVQTVLNPDNVIRMIDEAAAEFSMADWIQAPAVKMCNVTQSLVLMKRWATDRHATLIKAGLAAP